MTRGRRVGLAAAIVLASFVLYEVVSSYVAFTDDAYVQSDLIALAPEVSGRIVAVHVADNQDVATGDLLASIDPVPFQFARDQRRAELAEAKAQVASDQARIAAARDTLAAASSAADYARETEKRLTTLASAQDISRVTLDQAGDALRRANAARDAAQQAVTASEATLTMHQASEAHANAALALAEWQLARTALTAPASGTITSLSLRVGDTAQTGVPLVGIVDANAFRIVANYRESFIRGFSVGSTAWVSLDSNPWHLHRATVTGIARGISRDPVPNHLLNYVAPTTDWIRLKRRFPVTLRLVDPPKDLRLYMGADARVVVLP
jgi:membrane fusion protein, multidrug efflux system